MDDVKNEVDFKVVMDTHGATHRAENTHGATHGGEGTGKTGGNNSGPWSLTTNKQLADIQQYNIQYYKATRLGLQGHRVDKISNSKANGDYMIAC